MESINNEQQMQIAIEQQQFIQIALSLSAPLIRNQGITQPEEAVQVYAQTYQAVLRAAQEAGQS